MRPQEGEVGPALTGPTSVEAPQRSDKKATGFAYGTTETAFRPVAASRLRRKTVATTLIVALGLATVCALILGAGWLADHLPNIILGLCIVLLGIVFGALLAVRT